MKLFEFAVFSPCNSCTEVIEMHRAAYSEPKESENSIFFRYLSPILKIRIYFSLRGFLMSLDYGGPRKGI